jgi:hypothetical protein
MVHKGLKNFSIVINLTVTINLRHIGNNLNPESINTILKTMQEVTKPASYTQPLSGHSIRVVVALGLFEQGEPLERIMPRRGWQSDSTAQKYLRS